MGRVAKAEIVGKKKQSWLIATAAVVTTRMWKFSKRSVLYESTTVLKVVLGGSFIVATLLVLLLLISYFALGNVYVIDRLPVAVAVFAYLFLALMLLGKKHYTIVAWMLIGFYAFLAAFIMLRWSINAPVGILMLGFVILLAGVMVGAKAIIPVTGAAILLLFIVQTVTTLGTISPDYAALSKESAFVDVAAYGVIFSIFALISWLSGRRMEQSLQKALSAEAALAREKDLLAITLEERTRKLQESQLEETRQLYRFAELGQLSTVLLHELANHLSVLTLDIDDIEQRHRRSDAVMRAKESIGYLDDMVNQVRVQLQDNTTQKEFTIVNVIKDTLPLLETKAEKAQLELRLKSAKNLVDAQALGDPLRLSQVITILVSNAIDAYVGAPRLEGRPQIIIGLTAEKTYAKITVTDWGSGIPRAARKKLFEPFQSSKQSGMGIGLFVAKKMIETHFMGTISIDPRTDCTKFVIKIPILRQ